MGKRQVRAAIYVRQSKDAAGDGLGVARQRRAGEELCAARGWTVVEVIADNDTSASGSKPRKGFGRLLGLVDEKAVDVIVAWHVDRLARKLTDLEDVISRCESAGVRLATVSGDLDLGTDAGRLVGRILGAVARGEVERKSARQVAANRQRAELGRPAGGRRAFGFEPDGITHRRVEADALRGAYEQVLAGRTLTGIAVDLNEAGLVTGQSGGPWGREVLRGVLLNPRNMGMTVHRGQAVAPASWVPIVDEATFKAVAAILSDPSRRSNPHPGGARRHLLTAIARCGVCDDGTDIVSAYQGPGQRGTVNRRVYTCRSRRHVVRMADKIDDYVAAMVIARVTREDAIDLLVDHEAPDYAELHAERLIIDGKLIEAAEDYDNGVITKSQRDHLTNKHRARLEELDAVMAHPSRVPVLEDIIKAADPAAKWAEYTLDKRRAIVAALFETTIMRGLPGNHGRVVDKRTVRMVER